MKKIIALLLCFLFAFSFSVTVFANEVESTAEDEIILKSANVGDTLTAFKISTSGKATVTNSYSGKSGSFRSAKITTKIQKKVGVIWVTVSGGSWTDTSSSLNYSKSHSIQLSSTGTYRAHVVFVISGTGGPDDKITKNVQKTYTW